MNLKNFGLHAFLGNCVEKKERRKMLAIFLLFSAPMSVQKLFNSELDECLPNWNDWGEESIRWLRTSLLRLPFFVYLFVSNQLDMFFTNKLYRNKFKTVFFQQWTGNFHRHRGEWDIKLGFNGFLPFLRIDRLILNYNRCEQTLAEQRKLFQNTLQQKTQTWSIFRVWLDKSIPAFSATIQCFLIVILLQIPNC